MLIRNSSKNVFLTLNFYNLIYFCQAFIESIPDDPLINMWRGIDSAPLIVRGGPEPVLASSFKTWSPIGGWKPSDASAEAGRGASSSHVNPHDEMSLVSSHHPEESAVKSSETLVKPYESIIIQTLDHLKEPELTHKEKTAAYAHLMDILRRKPGLESIFVKHSEDPTRGSEVWEAQTLWNIATTAKFRDDGISSIEEIYGLKSPYQIIIRKFFDLDSTNLNAISDLRDAIEIYLARKPLNHNAARAQALEEIQSRLAAITPPSHHEVTSAELFKNEASVQWQDLTTLVKNLKTEEASTSSALAPERQEIPGEPSPANLHWRKLNKKIKASGRMFSNVKERYLNLNHENDFEVQEFREKIERLIESETLVDSHLKSVHEMKNQLQKEAKRVKLWRPTQGWNVPKGQKSTVVKELLQTINDPTISFGERVVMISRLDKSIANDPELAAELESIFQRDLTNPGLFKADVLIGLRNTLEAKNSQVHVLMKRFIALNKASADSINSLREDLERILINNQRLEHDSQESEEEFHLTASSTSEASSSSQAMKPEDEKPLSENDKALVNGMKELLISEHYPLENELVHEAGLASHPPTEEFKGLVTDPKDETKASTSGKHSRRALHL
ncbi:uncharacterized protein MELLADRAFT_91964 [Melampsora larici-populina 98AG31]|uniref:Uncharacterized protein n=1 Tax=Melampsora larici-populina (strain 98AG31 / pathotype 3-4-7) TaxID=747676 RepID=F4S116_MELLP|nr:uncharacterized protein MELLADRAFT_91964 [Melampsora larici-populina 98AG31]EGG01719.1 hypothetical protein MELLADRAFT_91964 [Melampsora larici-populina 98AG31]